MKLINETKFIDIKSTDKTKETIERIIECNKVKEFEELIDILYPNGIEINHLNDLLYYEQDDIYNCLEINKVDEYDIGW